MSAWLRGLCEKIRKLFGGRDGGDGGDSSRDDGYSFLDDSSFMKRVNTSFPTQDGNSGLFDRLNKHHVRDLNIGDTLDSTSESDSVDEPSDWGSPIKRGSPIRRRPPPEVKKVVFLF